MFNTDTLMVYAKQIGNARTLEGITLPQLERLLQTSIRMMRVLAVDQGLYLAYAKRKLFESPSEWLEWAECQTGSSKRTCYTLLSVGEMLWDLDPKYYEYHRMTDIKKLEIIAALGQGNQRKMLDNPDLQDLTRDQVRALVAETAGRAIPAQPESIPLANGIQGDFFAMLDCVAQYHFETQKSVIDTVSTIEASTLISAGTNVLMMLEAAADGGKFNIIPDTARREIALALRDTAIKFDC